MRTRSLPLLLLLALPALADSPAPTRLHFAWPDGMRAQVELHLTGERRTTGAPQRHDARTTFTLSTEKKDGELWVKREALGAWKGTLPDKLGSPADRLVDRIPVTRVSPEGTFLGIEGTDETREAFGREVKRSSLDPAHRKIFETMTSDAALRGVAVDFWNMSVGLWTQLELGPGDTHEMRNRTAVPQLGGGSLDMVLTARWVGPAACADEKTPRCVELELTSAPDPEQVGQLVGKALASAGGKGLVVEAFAVTQELRAVVEADTLRPHRLTLRRSNTMRIRAPGGRVESGSERAERAYVFRYTTPAPAPTTP